MTIDDVTYATVLAATAISIGIAAASALGDKTWHGAPVAQECPRSHSMPSASPRGTG